jgi:N-acyl-L-homoserine lactone synthetase
LDLEVIVLQLIAPEWHSQFAAERHEMHRLRYRVFKERLGWDVKVTDGTEADHFDSERPAYLLQRGFDGAIHGCVRLLPTTGPNMLRDIFSELLAGRPAPARSDVWESSRFALDVQRTATETTGGLATATYELFAGMIEFGLSYSLIDIVTVTDVRIERILHRAGWPLRRIGEPRIIGESKAIAGYLEISLEALQSVRRTGGIGQPVLWAPALPTAVAPRHEHLQIDPPSLPPLPQGGTAK